MLFVADQDIGELLGHSCRLLLGLGRCTRHAALRPCSAKWFSIASGKLREQRKADARRNVRHGRKPLPL
jgi:hypothetical protein